MLTRETVLDQVVKAEFSVQIIQDYRAMAFVNQMFVTLTQLTQLMDSVWLVHRVWFQILHTNDSVSLAT